MAGERDTAALIGGVGLLERAITYLLGSLHGVTPEALSRPTPCAEWDLRALLRHVDDSIRVLLEAVEEGHVDLDRPAAPAQGPKQNPTQDDPTLTVRGRATRLLGAWANAGGGVVSIAGCPLTAAIVSSTGAMEVAVHGWDIARARGHHRPIPPSLAEELLDLCPLLVTDAHRPGHFAPPVEIPRTAGAGDRLVAFLGRDPTPAVLDI